MSPEHQSRNAASWKASFHLYNKYWRHMGLSAILADGMAVGLDRHFQLWLDQGELIFLTGEYLGLGEPFVHVKSVSPRAILLRYRATNLDLLEYELPLEQALPTLRRFLAQLWNATMPGALPEELRGFAAPILEGRWIKAGPESLRYRDGK